MILCNRKNTIKTAISFGIAFTSLLFLGCATTNQSTELVGDSVRTLSNKSTAKNFELQKNNWNINAYNSIVSIISEYGDHNPKYNPDKKPYAVFDWDNTSIINDVEENLLRYQLQNLIFKMSPKKFYEVITKDIPQTPFNKEFNSRDGSQVNIALVSSDLIKDYEYLYSNYSGLKGNMSLNEIKGTPQYKDFNIKMMYLYDAISGSFSHDISYPWVLYLFRGMSKEEVQSMAERSIDYGLKQPLTIVSDSSPVELRGKTGVVTVSYRTGLRTIREMQDLYSTLMKNGFDVYICSASFVDVVQLFASNKKYGYNIPTENVIAMELERDSFGTITDSYRECYTQTQSEGKTENIKRFLVKKYGYGPLIVGGDSSGDYAMMSDFKDTKLVLLIDRKQTGKIGEFRNKALRSEESDNRKIILQGRDESKGVFIPESESILLGLTH